MAAETSLTPDLHHAVLRLNQLNFQPSDSLLRLCLRLNLSLTWRLIHTYVRVPRLCTEVTVMTKILNRSFDAKCSKYWTWAIYSTKGHESSKPSMVIKSMHHITSMYVAENSMKCTYFCKCFNCHRLIGESMNHWPSGLCTDATEQSLPGQSLGLRPRLDCIILHTHIHIIIYPSIRSQSASWNVRLTYIRVACPCERGVYELYEYI